MVKKIQSLLQDSYPWKQSIFYFETLESTNTFAKQLAAQGASHGTVILADSQTGGRGRMGRSFHSPAGSGIYLSMILRPGCHASKLMHLTCAAGVAVCDAVEAYAGFRPGIKWINDLICGSRKLGGILTELSLCADGSVDYAVVGIGINCSQKVGDFPPDIQDIATSLWETTGKEISRPALTVALLEKLADMSHSLFGPRDVLMARYRSDCVTLGNEVLLLGADGSNRKGFALDVDTEGSLIVRFADGHTEAVSSGEASVRSYA